MLIAWLLVSIHASRVKGQRSMFLAQSCRFAPANPVSPPHALLSLHRILLHTCQSITTYMLCGQGGYLSKHSRRRRTKPVHAHAGPVLLDVP